MLLKNVKCCITFYLFIAILCAKILRVNRTLKRKENEKKYQMNIFYLWRRGGSAFARESMA